MRNMCCSAGAEVFVYLSVWCLIVILPTNLTVGSAVMELVTLRLLMPTGFTNRRSVQTPEERGEKPRGCGIGGTEVQDEHVKLVLLLRAQPVLSALAGSCSERPAQPRSDKRTGGELMGSSPIFLLFSADYC
jgi:hypothetical protein